MKKFLALLLSMVLVGTLLTGCTSGADNEIFTSDVSNDKKNEAKSASEEIVEIEVAEEVEKVDEFARIKSMSAEDILSKAFSKTTSSSGTLELNVNIDMQLDTSSLTEDEANQFKESLYYSQNLIRLDNNDSTNFMYIAGAIYFTVCEAACYTSSDMVVNMFDEHFDEDITTKVYVDNIEKKQYTLHDEKGDWVIKDISVDGADTDVFGDITGSLFDISEPVFNDEDEKIFIEASINSENLDGISSSSNYVDIVHDSVPVTITIDYNLNLVSVKFDMTSMLGVDAWLGWGLADLDIEDMFKFDTTEAYFILTYENLNAEEIEIPDWIKEEAISEESNTGMGDTVAEIIHCEDMFEEELWNKEFKHLYGEYASLGQLYDDEGQQVFQNFLRLIYDSTEDDLFYMLEHLDELDNSQRYAIYLLSYIDLPNYNFDSMIDIIYDINAKPELREAYEEMQSWKELHGLHW